MYNQRDMEPFVTFCPTPNRKLDPGVEAEIRTARYLFDNLKARFVGQYRILVNYNFPIRGADALEIDLLVITSYGVFLLEVKNWLGIIEAHDEYWLANGDRRENVFSSINFKKNTIFSHVRDIRGLPFEADKISVVPLVVLARGTQTFKNFSSTYDSRGVAGLDQHLLHALSSIELLRRQERSQRLSDRDIGIVCDALFRRHKPDKAITVGMAGQYQLLTLLEDTALFDVIDAQHTGVSSRRVRLKRYHLHNISNLKVTEHTIEQFKRSIEVLSSLGDHKNIVETIDFFPDLNNYDLYYEVTKPIDGLRMDKLMEQWSEDGDSFSLEEQMIILEQICRALNHAHTHKNSDGNPDPVYHRNVCFETIYFDRNIKANTTTIKLADFNFAKFGKHTINPMYWGGAENRKQKLIESAFTAPEVLADASDATAASDIYSLGVLWYFLALLPQYDPKAQFDPETDRSKIDALPLPEKARSLLKRMVDYNADKRPQRVKEILDVLKQLKTKE